MQKHFLFGAYILVIKCNISPLTANHITSTREISLVGFLEAVWQRARG